MSVDSDDQIFTNKSDDADGSLLVNGENVKYSYCDNLRKSQCVDKNGNNVPADNLNNNFYNGSTENGENVKPSKQADQKAITRLQAMAMSDDEDFGKNTK